MLFIELQVLYRIDIAQLIFFILLPVQSYDYLKE